MSETGTVFDIQKFFAARWSGDPNHRISERMPDALRLVP